MTAVGGITDDVGGNMVDDVTPRTSEVKVLRYGISQVVLMRAS